MFVLFFKIEFLYVSLAVPELALLTLLTSNSHRSTYLCLQNAGIKRCVPPPPGPEGSFIRVLKKSPRAGSYELQGPPGGIERRRKSYPVEAGSHRVVGRGFRERVKEAKEGETLS